MAPPLDEEYLRETLIGLITGVQALHDYGMLHRDLKPDNVMVNSQGRAVVLDFGLVADIEGRAGTRPGDEDHSGITGTPRYLAPELAWDEPLGEAADWYSVGVMLYEVLTGRPPIEADTTIAELYQKNENPPTPVREYQPGACADLREVCMELLAIDPDERPDGPELLDRLGVDADQSGHIRVAPGRRSRDEQFVGRVESLETLETLAEKTFFGKHPTLVDIRGESGVGKSTLADRFLEDWSKRHPETAILRGSCYENESVPYKALDGVIDELVPWLEELPEDELDELLGDGAGAVAQLFPVLRQLDPIFQTDGLLVTMSESQLRHEAFEALRRIIRRLTEDHSLIICIDDVQWGDEDSVMLLDHLLSGEDPPPLMLITTWRDEDAEASPFLGPYLEMREELDAPVHLENLRLSELSQGDARQLAGRIVAEAADGQPETAPSDIDLDRIVEESGGNPLFVDELSRHTADAGTFDSDITEFDAILHKRLDDLSGVA
ncbi:MAG: AAA family ATPase, partial [Bradymonadaceae bacterium]